MRTGASGSCGAAKTGNAKLVQLDRFDSGVGKELKAVRFSKKNGESELF